jgi:uncharacterized membrane protein (UPF0127 family)
MLECVRSVRSWRSLGAVAALICVGCAQASVPSLPLQSLTHFPRTTLTIAAGTRVYRFHVWVANTPARQIQGLMFVRDLPASEGMLFPLHPPQVALFWMENTYIPLDMLFVAPNGRIAKIVANAPPFSLKTISSGVPVEAVIEIRGGEAGALGLAVGQSVSWNPPTAG